MTCILFHDLQLCVKQFTIAIVNSREEISAWLAQKSFSRSIRCCLPMVKRAASKRVPSGGTQCSITRSFTSGPKCCKPPRRWACGVRAYGIAFIVIPIIRTVRGDGHGVGHLHALPVCPRGVLPLRRAAAGPIPPRLRRGQARSPRCQGRTSPLPPRGGPSPPWWLRLPALLLRRFSSAVAACGLHCDGSALPWQRYNKLPVPARSPPQ